jgi:hypothetical protein
MVTKRMFVLACLIVVCVLLAALRSRVAHQDGSLSDRGADSGGRVAFFDTARSTVPFVYICMYPKYPGDDEEVVGGLKVAVWQNGTIVRIRSAAEVGKAYIQGRLRPQQLDELVRLIESSGILTTKSNETSPMHQESDFLRIRTRLGLQVWSHTVPNAENAKVKQIEDVLMAIDIPQAEPSSWEIHFPHEWEK